MPTTVVMRELPASSVVGVLAPSLKYGLSVADSVTPRVVSPMSTKWLSVSQSVRVFSFA